MENLMKLREKAMEDKYFHEVEQQKNKDLNDKDYKQKCFKFLTALGGIQGEDVLEVAFAENIRPNNVFALMYLPLVETAWADGAVGAEEKRKLLQTLGDEGLTKTGQEMEIIGQWLEKRPQAKLKDVWKSFFDGQAKTMQAEQLETEIDKIQGHCLEIAKSCGLLALPHVTKGEKEWLDELNEFFSLCQTVN